jgi:hypothetical protein
VVPKFDPVIVTEVPEIPDVGEIPLITGGTAKIIPLLVALPTTTVTGPVDAPFGTGTTILVLLQLVGAADKPLNRTVLVPWVGPKFRPVTLTGVPGGPETGEILVMLSVIVKVAGLLA